MLPSGGEITAVDQPMTWSPVGSALSSRTAKQRWLRCAPACDRLGRPAGARHDLAVAQGDVGLEIMVAALLGGDARRRLGMATEGVDRRAGRLGHGARGRRMIGVGVGDEDVRDRLAAHRVEHGVDVVGHVRAGIDDRHLAVADDVGAGAHEGEGTGVLRHHAPDQRRDALRRAVGGIELLDEQDRHGWPCGVCHSERSEESGFAASDDRSQRTGISL